MKIEVITNENQFYSMRREWNDTLDKSGIENPFLTHEFLSSWWRGYQNGKQLTVIVIKDSGKITGLIPLLSTRVKLSGISVQAVQFFADHWGQMDFILTEKPKECIEEFVEWFQMNKSSHILILSRLSNKSKNAEILKRVLQSQGISFQERAIDQAVININGSWEEYLAKRSKKFRYQLKDKRNRLEKLGRVDYERTSDFSDTNKSLSSLFSVARNS